MSEVHDPQKEIDLEFINKLDNLNSSFASPSLVLANMLDNSQKIALLQKIDQLFLDTYGNLVNEAINGLPGPVGNDQTDDED